MPLAGRTALVTGGSRGIGRAICVRLASDGADIAINFANTAEAAHEVLEEGRALGRRAEVYQADVADRAAVDAMCQQALSDLGQMVNVTLCFSANQALLAAKAGATFISPFIGRLDDINLDGLDLIGDIRLIYDNYGYDTQILAASIRTVNHVTQSALIGADVATLPPKIIHELYKHELTDKGLKSFLEDWSKTGQSIIPKK